MADEFTKAALYWIKTFNEKVKEKIWIEKLIELLNEYHHFNSDLIYYWWDEEHERVYFHTELPEEQKKKLWDALIDDGIDEQRVGNEWVCSKKFWFIKWLVENDKINKDLVSRVLIRAYVSPKTMVSLECEFYDYYESLLMLLSISSSPIEDLILYLK